MTTEDGREVRISANPLNGSTSIDTPLDDTDGGSATLGDLQEDRQPPGIPDRRG